ncbi:MAG: AAA family ATPase, partial [Kiloniellales bacterium]
RLSGFKSFVDPIELPIEPGLSGIVGPNGCGKSNLVEAIQWVMGESAPKEMRGAEMDNVIFGGTAERPARNIAEAIILLDNRARRAPAAFNDADQLEVARHIERGAGSAYRINGREVRARDVQILFADAATGARSTALVRQGQIGALISARPHQRRALLDEAAGITGLHSRRHEAELRLGAAETNLARLDDVLVTLEGQLQGLKRQARQAARYRNISDHIRRAEAIQLHLKWGAASEAWDAAKAELDAAEKTVAELTRRAGAAATAQAEAAARLPDLRQAEAEAAAGLHRLALARDGLDSEEARIQEARLEGETRLSQIAADIEREQALAGDAAAALECLDGEQSALTTAPGDEETARQAAGRRLEAAAAEAQAAEADLTRLTEQVAADQARRAQLQAQLADLERRQAGIQHRLDEVAPERDAVEAEAADEAAASEAEKALDQARERQEAARREAEAAERARAAAEAEAAAARAELEPAEGERAKLRAEEAALTELSKEDQRQGGPPLIDDVTVEAGYEAALGAALGDDLVAPADESAPV